MCEIARPANDAREAVQWTYFAYLGAIKEANGAAMSIGRISSFLDIYFERDLKQGSLDEAGAQELWDQLVQKLRIVRFLRTPEYDALFSGDPYWATECVGGVDLNGKPLVTKSSYRMLHTLTNLGPAPEPNITVLWSKYMPDNFKRYCIRVSRETSSLQYENDDLMRPHWGDDYGIACCVSAMRLGKQMQFFGARVNLAKCLLYAINGGRDEMSGEQVAPPAPPITSEVLDYDEVTEKFDHMMKWLARTYVHAINCIHYMHDKYFYERLEMALHDRDILRTMAFGIAGLSVVADSLAAIKYADVHVIRDETGLAVDYRIEGMKEGTNQVPQFGNNDDRVDSIAANLVTRFMGKLRKHPTYRNATHTQSVLTITSNVVYGKHTGNTPDGRRKGEPFGPGANPMHGRDSHGWLASCLSVAKLPYKDALDGISYTVSVAPQKAHLSDQELTDAAVKAVDLYFSQGGFHMNLNVIDKETLEVRRTKLTAYPDTRIVSCGYLSGFFNVSLGLGMVMGVLLGLIPIPIPGVGTVTLGIGGGPLIVALILGKLRQTGPMIWVMPLPANIVLRNFGLAMFLAAVGVNAGAPFVRTVSETGFSLLLIGAAVLLTTVLIVLLVGYYLLKIPFDDLVGVASGATGNPAILVYSTRMAPTERPDIGYAMIFPSMTIVKVIAVQIVGLLVGGAGAG
jgi:formate C-acetyltransferase